MTRTAEDKRVRGRQSPVAALQFAQQSWVNGNTDVLTPDLVVNGMVEQIEVVISNATNGITFTVAIATEDGGALYSQAAIPENASTIYKATSDASAFDAFLAAGTLTATLTPSGDPGESGVTVDVILYTR
jgi:hypothetical protein